MNNFKNFKDCPIGEYVRIVGLKDSPVETLTDEELWVLYTKAQVDAASGQSVEYLRRYEAELVERGILTTTQMSFFEENTNK